MMLAGALTAALSATAFIAFLAVNAALLWRFRASLAHALAGPPRETIRHFSPAGEPASGRSNVVPLRRVEVVRAPALRLAA